VTVEELGQAGCGRTLSGKLALFVVVVLLSGAHGVAVRRGRERAARVLAVATLVGSVEVVLLATALVP
jgi:hypothetical protein